jgi:TRAP-type C4-dicarboxylate transport system substrate-binding protein
VYFKYNFHVPRFVDLRLSATPILVLMNKSSYERLSDQDRQVIDEHSGRWFSEWIAKKGTILMLNAVRLSLVRAI